MLYSVLGLLPLNLDFTYAEFHYSYLTVKKERYLVFFSICSEKMLRFFKHLSFFFGLIVKCLLTDLLTFINVCSTFIFGTFCNVILIKYLLIVLFSYYRTLFSA